MELLEQLARASTDFVLEVTMDSDAAVADIKALRKSNISVGAGTVLTQRQAQEAIDAGASFLVSPILDVALVAWSTRRGVPFIPGALTPTEIMRAWNGGAAAVKIFPASAVGPQFLREVRGPLGDLPLVVTGGINAGNARSFLDAGATAVGIGGWLTNAPAQEIPRRLKELRGQIDGDLRVT
jgi:2-dehydro-3-deoxyphosphogluconate aldolase / (4S)-4-hydroxy-2-oxoglutarate aldolase